MSDDITTGESGISNSHGPEIWNPMDHGLHGLPLMVPAFEYNKIKSELAEANEEITRYAEGVNIYAEQLAELEEKNNQLQWQINADSECIERVTRNGVAAELKLAESEAGNARLRKALENVLHEYRYCVRFECGGRWNPDEMARVKSAHSALATNSGESALEAVREVSEWMEHLRRFLPSSGSFGCEGIDRHEALTSRLRETFGTGGSEG